MRIVIAYALVAAFFALMLWSTYDTLKNQNFIEGWY